MVPCPTTTLFRGRRTSPLVAVEMPSRASNAVLTVDSREARDIEISFRFPWAMLLRVVIGRFCRDLGRESQGSDIPQPSSPAKAGDPVFRDASVQPQRSRR